VALEGHLAKQVLAKGQPAMDDTGGAVGVINYADQMDDATAAFISDATGLVSTFIEEEWAISGDGTSGMWTPVVYTPHDASGENILANAVGSNDKLYVRAKASIAGTTLRVDLQDVEGFVTNAAAVENALTATYEIYEIDFANSYNDGGYGGTPCETGPCPVDGERIANLQFFINPGVGGLGGNVTIDWISFGSPITTSVEDVTRLQSLKAFPNPAIDEMNVVLETVKSGNIAIYIFNTVGQVVATEHLGFVGNGKIVQPIDVNKLPQGIYTVHVFMDDINVGFLKFVK